MRSVVGLSAEMRGLRSTDGQCRCCAETQNMRCEDAMKETVTPDFQRLGGEKEGSSNRARPADCDAHETQE